MKTRFSSFFFIKSKSLFRENLWLKAKSEAQKVRSVKVRISFHLDGWMISPNKVQSHLTKLHVWFLQVLNGSSRSQEGSQSRASIQSPKFHSTAYISTSHENLWHISRSSEIAQIFLNLNHILAILDLENTQLVSRNVIFREHLSSTQRVRTKRFAHNHHRIRPNKVFYEFRSKQAQTFGHD